MKCGGVIWQDDTIDDWPENDFRIFCGDLGNEVTDEVLINLILGFSNCF